VRKRVVIGAMAAVVIGVAAHVFSQPKEGMFEYHKKEYLNAGVPEWALVRGVPGFVRHFYERHFTHELEFHRRALIDGGYLRESVFVVSNASAGNVMRAVQMELPGYIGEFTSMACFASDPNAITVTAPREWMDEIGEAIRKADIEEARTTFFHRVE
jgi:hypothetical protein